MQDTITLEMEVEPAFVNALKVRERSRPLAQWRPCQASIRELFGYALPWPLRRLRDRSKNGCDQVGYLSALARRRFSHVHVRRLSHHVPKRSALYRTQTLVTGSDPAGATACSNLAGL